jgi:hypothetical protein
MKLDIACGQAKPEGFVGIDLADCEGVDIRHDLTSFPWPIDSGSVTEARCCHYFEHVPRLDRPHFMSELWRILADDAGCSFITPLGLWRQFQDFTHTWPVVPSSFLYFHRPTLRQWGIDHYIGLYGLVCNFEIVGQQVSVIPEYEHLTGQELIDRTFHELNAGMDLLTVLRKLPLEG